MYAPIQRAQMGVFMIEKNTLNKNSRLSGFNSAPWIAFFSTLAMLSLFFLVTGTSPFGPNTILISDLGIQYAPFLIGYKEHLLSGDMLSYSFLLGMGKNTLGLFAYYLSSPFNFLTFLFPKGMISQAVVMLIMSKLALASVFATLFLQKRSGLKAKMSALFGVSYAMSSYAVVYMINIIWLDGFMLFPLLLLFIEYYLEDTRKWGRLVGLLLLMFVSGFYIAYMVGIFSFIYLVIRLIEDYRPGTDSQKNINILFKYVGSALLAAGISAIILLPAGVDTLSNPDYRAAKLTISGRFVLTDILNQLFSGTFDSLHSNKPFIYSGLGITFLVILYFLNPAIARRSKIVLGAILTGFLLSFHLNLLDYVWHLFDIPNWFQYRNAFLLVLMLILYAYLSYLKRDSLTPKHFIQAGLILLSGLICVSVLGDMRTESLRLYVNLIFGLLYFLILLGITVPKWPETITRLRRLAIPALVVLVCVDIAIANPLMLRFRSLGLQSVHASQVSDDIRYAETLVEQARERSTGNDSFRRIEIDNHINSIEASSGSAFLGIHSMSDFQSGSNKQLHRFLKQLGFATNYNYFSSMHNYTSVVADSFLGISHVLSEREDCYGLAPMSSAGETSFKTPDVQENEYTDKSDAKPQRIRSEIFLFENESALPLMFTVRPDASTFDFYSLEKETEDKDYFHFQNQWLASMFESFDRGDSVFYPAGEVEMSVFNAIQSEKWEIEPEKDQLIDLDTLGDEPVGNTGDGLTHYFQINPEAKISLDYELVVESEDPLYISVPHIGGGFEGEVRLDGEMVWYLNRSHYTMILFLGCFSPGETIHVSVVFDQEVSVASLLDTQFYYCDTQKFTELLAEQDPAEGISDLAVEDGRVSASVKLTEDRLLLTTIPYERGWTLRVDGVKTDIVPYQDALISVPLKAGDHSIRLEFRAPGLTAGIIISSISLCAFVLLMLVGRAKSKRSKP
jgi:uncharacterized membrane protein YfhO